MRFLNNHQSDNPTQDSNNYMSHHGSYEMEEEQDENFIELLENNKENGQKIDKYEENNKYALSQHDTLFNQNRNNKIKNVKMIKSPIQISEKPFVLNGNSFKTNEMRYNPLKDDHLKGFFLNKNVRKQIKQNQLVDKEGKIIDKYHVKLNSSKESQNHPINNIALSFQINISNENTCKQEDNNLFSVNDSENFYRIDKNMQKDRDEAMIETLDENQNKQDQIQKSESPFNKKRERQLQLSQKQLQQKSIYQKTYQTGYNSDRSYQNSSRANIKSACGGYSKSTINPFRRESIKCKTPDPYQKQQGMLNTITKNQISPEKKILSQQRSATVQMEERKKILQERKELVKKQQQQLAQQLVIQNQIKLAKLKEQQQQKLLQIQKQQEQLNYYRRLINSPNKMNENRKELSPQYFKHNNTSNYLSKSPNIPNKLNNGKRAKTNVYQMTETYTQFDKQIMKNNKRCISLESQNNNSILNIHPNIKNKYNENVNNKQILSKLNQNMIQISNINTKNNFNRSPLSTTQKQITSKSDKKENQPFSITNQYHQRNGRFAPISRGSSNYRSYNKKITNLELPSTYKRSLPSISDKIGTSPFTPSRIDQSKTPKRTERFSSNLKSRSLTLNLNDLNETKKTQRSLSQISKRELTSRNKLEDQIKYKQQDTQIKQNQQNEEDKQIRSQYSLRKQDSLQMTKDQFQSYMIQQVKTLQEENEKIKQNQNAEIKQNQNTESELSKKQFDSFMQMHKQKINSQTNTISPRRNNNEQYIEEED